MKVIDVFPFFNEVNLLKIRLETIHEFVDHFVIIEANRTFSGEEKSSVFLENKELFKDFQNKIVHVWLDDIPSGLTPFEREWFQRNAASEVLEELCDQDDLVVFGDVDEIPSPEVLQFANGHNFERRQVIHCAQTLYYYFLNLREVSGNLLSFSGEYPWVIRKKWLGTVITTYGYISKFELANFRSPKQKKNGYRFRNGGWHFSFIGEASDLGVEDRISKKIKSYAHQEYNNSEVLNSISTNVSSQKDLFGRKKSKFKKLSNLVSLPKYVQQNPEDFKGAILK